MEDHYDDLFETPVIPIRLYSHIMAVFSFSGTTLNPAFHKYPGLYILTRNAQCYPVYLVGSVVNVIEGDCQV
jgi:hypothetical protein